MFLVSFLLKKYIFPIPIFSFIYTFLTTSVCLLPAFKFSSSFLHVNLQTPLIKQLSTVVYPLFFVCFYHYFCIIIILVCFFFKWPIQTLKIQGFKVLSYAILIIRINPVFNFSILCCNNCKSFSLKHTCNGI